MLVILIEVKPSSTVALFASQPGVVESARIVLLPRRQPLTYQFFAGRTGNVMSGNGFG
jgi:hypothetical protein